MSTENDVPPATSRWWPYQEALAYRMRLPAGRPPATPALLGLRAVFLTESTIQRLFAAEPALKRRFLRFVRQGAVGVAIVHGRTWLTYAWMATPEGKAPYHLPGAMAGQYWIYYCHTRAPYRGRGLLAAAVKRLLAEASTRSQLQAVEVYCDVLPDNMPSRRAFLRLGFQPAGKVATWRLPKSSLVMGSWDESASHDSAPMTYAKSS